MEPLPPLPRWWQAPGPWAAGLEPPRTGPARDAARTGPIAWAALLAGGEPTMPLEDAGTDPPVAWRPQRGRALHAPSLEAALAWARTSLAEAPVGWSVAFRRRGDPRVRWRARGVDDVRSAARLLAGWSGAVPGVAATRADHPRGGRLTASQRAVVEHDAGRAVVLAVAGAGKTTTMVARVRHRVATGRTSARHLLVVSFSRAAVAAVRAALGEAAATADVDVRTFHSLAHVLLTTDARWGEGVARAKVARTAGPPADDVVAAVVARARREATARDPDLADAWRAADLTAFAAYRGRALARLELPGLAARPLPRAAAREARPPPPDADHPAHPDLLEDFERVRAELGWLDHDQVLVEAWAALHTHERLWAWARSRWRAVVVDEAQDVNAVQLALLERLTKGRDDVVLVGDDDQSVYGFRGAEPGLLRAFAARHDARVLVLDDAFRTRAEPLAAAVALMSHGRDRFGVRARAARGRGGTLTLDEADGAEGEAEAMLARLQAHRGAGLPWSAQAVLLRRFDQAPVIEYEAASAGVPLRLEGTPPLDAHPEVIAAWAGVALALGVPGAPAVRERAWRRWLAGPVGLARSAAWAAARAVAHDPSPGATAWRTSAPRGSDAAIGVRLAEVADAATALAALRAAGAVPRVWPDDVGLRLRYALATLAQRSPAATPAEGLARWRSDRRAPPPGDAVLVTSCHRSKGLEWPVVHVPGLTAGVFPIGDDPEERRLAYVAWTRPREALHLYRDRQRPPSPFLAQGEVREVTALADDLAWCEAGVGTDSLAAAWARHEAAARFGTRTVPDAADRVPAVDGVPADARTLRGTLAADPRPGPLPRRGQEDAVATHRP